MKERVRIRPVDQGDYEDWRPLWDGYNAFYGRIGSTGFRRTSRKVRGTGFSNRSTNRADNVCYLQDLFTAETVRGLGVGRRLIEGVYQAARDAGCSRVDWHTQAKNEVARVLYDKLAQHQGFIVYSHDL